MGNKAYDKDAVIFREGDAGNSMFIVHGGAVGIYSSYGKADEKKLAELLPDDSFGEMSILEAEPRSTTAVALENGTELEEISGAEFDRFLREKPDDAKRIMRQMSRRIRDLTSDYLEACRIVADIHETEKAGAERTPELHDRMQSVLSIYQTRYPTLFNITMKEAKDDVQFRFKPD